MWKRRVLSLVIVSPTKAGPMLIFDKSCVTKVGTSKYNKEAAKKVTKLVKEFFITTFKLQ